MRNRHHTTAEQRKADRERTKAMQDAQSKAVKVCRVLMEAWHPETGTWDNNDLLMARVAAQSVIDQIDGVKR
ncbi:hypothetical protein [Celeribacter naphthalenivorans]|uniref:hypothetical protein n=1 Tax=Celeribacter naphthalenivorans TaxID=1614694 RepID=UPI001CFB85EF|nr:hypothetical protein [Celeribacter naphthalenivorans]